MAVQLSPDLQSSTKWIVWFMTLQFQAAIGDIMIVLPSVPDLRPPLVMTDGARQQIYRMYHIYDRKLSICVVPSIATAALFGEFVLPWALLRPLITILQPSVVAWWTNFGIPRHCPTRVQWLAGPGAPSVSQYCKFLHISSILEQCSPKDFSIQ